MSDLVAIARIVKPRGIRGEVIAEVLTDFPERFEKLKEVVLLKPDRKEVSLKIQEAWFQNNRIVLKFENFDSIEEAETLRGSEICVKETETIELAEGEFYEWRLVGCEVETIAGEKLGRVRELLRTGAAQILVVEGGAKEYLIPFAKKICVETDIEKRVIRVDPPEGLLDF